MRLNLQKCIFVSNSVQYLGYTITAKGITPGKEKTEAIAKASPPTCQKKLRSFLGLANYFRQYIPRFAQLAAPLFQLTRKSTDWRDNTPLPPQAQSAFEQIRAAIVSKPCMAYPSRSGKYTLQVDAAQGDAKNAGGLGAVLMQTQPCLLYTSPSPRDKRQSRMPSSA